MRKKLILIKISLTSVIFINVKLCQLWIYFEAQQWLRDKLISVMDFNIFVDMVT